MHLRRFHGAAFDYGRLEQLFSHEVAMKTTKKNLPLSSIAFADSKSYSASSIHSVVSGFMVSNPQSEIRIPKWKSAVPLLEVLHEGDEGVYRVLADRVVDARANPSDGAVALQSDQSGLLRLGDERLLELLAR